MPAVGAWNRLAWPLVAAGILGVPLLVGRGFYLNVLNFVALYAMVAIGLCLLVGHGGQLSISHAAFFAIGAYGSAILSLRGGMPPVLAILGAQGVAALAAWGIGAVVLRLKGHYLAIATLSFGLVVEVLIKEMSWLTGGLQGLSGIPPLRVGGLVLDTDWRFFYVVWPTTLLVLLFALNMVESRLGRAYRAIKEGEDIARLFGVDARAYKVQLFVVSSVFASLSGSLFAHFVAFVSPATASVMFAIDIIMVLALGGFTMLWGAVVGVAALTAMNEYLTGFAEYKRMIYGLVLVALVLLFPGGLVPGLGAHLARARRVLRRREVAGAR